MTKDERNKTIKYLVLTLMRGIGPVTQNHLLDICGSIDKCFLLDEAELLQADIGAHIGRERIKRFVSQRKDEQLWDRAEEIIDSADKNDIQICTRGEKDYPNRFRGLSDIPLIIYVKGKLKINNFPMSVGIVGARRCSAEGKEKAIELVQMSVADGVAVISGMAKGIDSYAHTAALKSNGYTIAVLGSGVDICYPKEHELLYEKIAESGSIISEYPPGTQPRDYLFPRRNRLIAALSDRIYVIEAGRKSGTLSTAESGEKYGRGVVRVL